MVENIKEINPTVTENMIKTELYKMISQNNDRNVYSFNMMKIYPDGLVKTQSHVEEHVVFVFSGKCKIMLGKEWFSMQTGDFLHIPSTEVHSFVNYEKEPTEILILKI